MVSPSLSAASIVYPDDPLGLTGIAINNAGVAVGTTATLPFESGTSDAFLSQNGQIAEMVIPAGFSQIQPLAINSAGVVAGGLTYGQSSQAFTDVNGSFTLLPTTAAGLWSIAAGLNDSGSVVGWEHLPSGAAQAVLWQGGQQPSILSNPSGDVQSGAYAINNAGQIVGSAQLPNTGTEPINEAVLWQNGAAYRLPSLTANFSSTAFAINASGEIAGYSTASDGSSHAVIWENDQIQDLGVPAGFANSEAISVNDQGQVVGFATAANGTTHAFLWQNGTALDLNTLLSGNDWVLLGARGINDEGQIVGNGTFFGNSAGFLLTLSNGGATIETSSQLLVQSFEAGTISTPAALADSGANVAAALDGLEAMAASGKLAGVTLTDGSNVPALSITAAQLSADKGALADISSDFALNIALDSTSVTLTGLAGHGNTAVFNGPSSQYNVTVSSSELTVSDGGTVDHLSNFTALRFSDVTEIVAAAPGTGSTVTTGNITALYGAVFGRIPDVAGLAFYQKILLNNPATPLTTFAEDFLSSPEYTANGANAYPQTSAGDAQFIANTYENLLHRSPGAGDVAWYQANVIAPILNGAAPGTSAYTRAEMTAHAQILADFSSSTEFLADVQITPQTPANAQHWLILM